MLSCRNKTWALRLFVSKILKKSKENKITMNIESLHSLSIPLQVFFRNFQNDTSSIINLATTFRLTKANFKWPFFSLVVSTPREGERVQCKNKSGNNKSKLIHVLGRECTFQVTESRIRKSWATSSNKMFSLCYFVPAIVDSVYLKNLPCRASCLL